MQVVLSFLEGPEADWDSCHEAYAAYMRVLDMQPSSQQTTSWKAAADQLETDIVEAQAAEDSCAVVLELLQKHPRAHALHQLKAAVDLLCHSPGQHMSAGDQQAEPSQGVPIVKSALQHYSLFQQKMGNCIQHLTCTLRFTCTYNMRTTHHACVSGLIRALALALPPATG